jgi:hypothetical protein
MRVKLLLACMACSGSSSIVAMELPVAGQDYYSLQIASGQNAQALAKLYGRYVELPFARVERRGVQYVLRVGFWPDQTTARLAVSNASVSGSFIRVAAFRSEAIVQQNWREGAALEAASVAAAASVPVPPPLSAPRPPPTPPAINRMEPSAARTALEPTLADAMMRPFNPEDFALAYDILVGSGDLARALQVAQHAVQQVPKDIGWRRKLARVAEWTQRPLVAGEQWRALFELGDRSPETVLAVIRWSPLVDSPLLALRAWAVRETQTPLTPEQWTDVFDLYERAAEPDKGSRFFEAQFEQKKTPIFLEYAARLAENGGQSERAEALNMRRAQLEPFSLDAVLRAVVSLVRRDHMREAFALMQTYESKVPAGTAEYWRLLGQIAWELREYAPAQDAYQRVAQTPLATPSDWSRLVFLVRQSHPIQAADLAMDAFRRFGARDQLVFALELYAESNDSQALARVFKSLSVDELGKAEQDVQFLLIRAQFRQRQKLPDLAWADLRRALYLRPDATNVALAAMWFLIDEARIEPLSELLKHYLDQADKDPAYWLAYAAGNQVLDRHHEAAIWYAKSIRLSPEDPLILLNFADALERIQRAGMAARVRRHAWLNLKQKYQQPENLQSLEKDTQLLAMVRLALLNQPGDQSLHVVRQLASQLRGLPVDQADSTQRAALVLGWAVTKEQYANARAWMWLRYARQSVAQPPLWGDSQVALQLQETQTMDFLLRQKSSGLPIYNRYDTAYALGDVQQALGIAFKGMASQDDEPLHDRFRQHAPLQANYVQVRASTENSDTLNVRGLQFETRLVVTPKLQFIIGSSHMTQSSDDPNFAFVASLADSDRVTSIESRWLGQQGDSSVTLFQHGEVRDLTGLRLKQTYALDGRLNLEAGLNYQTDTTLSLPLRLVGYENSQYLSFNYTLGKREYFRISPHFSSYYTQYGENLGTGRSLDLELGYRIRTEYPGWRVRAISTQQQLSPSTTSALTQPRIINGISYPATHLIPEGSTTSGVCLDVGQNLQTTYTRAWRPFFDACITHNSVVGSGYTGVLGVAGSLMGEDHLLIQMENRNQSAPGSVSTQSLILKYRHYY